MTPAKPVTITVGGSLPWNVPAPKTATSGIVGFASLAVACVLQKYGLNIDPSLVGLIIVTLSTIASHFAPHLEVDNGKEEA